LASRVAAGGAAPTTSLGGSRQLAQAPGHAILIRGSIRGIASEIVGAAWSDEIARGGAIIQSASVAPRAATAIAALPMP